MSQVLTTYVYRQHLLAYFCFPCLGVAVSLHPGDAIIFNPLKPYCLPRWCPKIITWWQCTWKPVSLDSITTVFTSLKSKTIFTANYEWNCIYIGNLLETCLSPYHLECSSCSVHWDKETAVNHSGSAPQHSPSLAHNLIPIVWQITNNYNLDFQQSIFYSRLVLFDSTTPRVLMMKLSEVMAWNMKCSWALDVSWCLPTLYSRVFSFVSSGRVDLFHSLLIGLR